MCSPAVMARVQEKLVQKHGPDRRQLLKAGAAALATIPFLAHQASARQATPVASPVTPMNLNIGSIVDLTHVLSTTFPVFAGSGQMEVEQLFSVAADGFYVNRLTLEEHTGTHLDAPAHFIDGALTAELLPVENFFAPIIVVDISAKAASDDDSALTIDDLMAWEAEFGPMPTGAFVAMYSGWEVRLDNPSTYVNLDGEGVQHYPGFDPEAAAFLVEERDIVGIGVDTLSQDPGISEDFATHVTILGAEKYAVENVANLSMLPPVGATVIVGGPKHLEASGGPARLYGVF
ncbi:MAG: cyclase family protein [Thermomicrobiales bacterium]